MHVYENVNFNLFGIFQKKTNSDIHEKMKFNRFNVYFYRGNNSNFTAY